MEENTVELSLNQATTRPYPLIATAEAAMQAGIRHIGLWIEPVQEIGIARTRRLLADTGLSVSSVCRAGFLAGKEGAELKEAMDSVRRALDLSHEVGSPMLTLIAGGFPEHDRSIRNAEDRLRARIEELEPHARETGVRLALEPLHPLFVQSRSVVTRIAQAHRVIKDFPAETVGILVDAYATAWDPTFDDDVLAAGPRIAGYQVSDFALPLPIPDNMNGRLFPGDGSLDLGSLTASVRRAGFIGPVEVEIFNEDIWELPLQTIVDRTVDSFARHLTQPLNALERQPV
ncbi:sugar phosphate isomerase/epimerase [Arthrobacter sp. yr096]|uniref:sugar phosphate isomerase/epimerase family protein n=1 Tax=Arthrobacter sp. yr096 TaxID=1761750 RepID=UPI0015A601E4|nr:sugar phosphate isomerase/epimerase [Arthrobacter sp. yr096]